MNQAALLPERHPTQDFFIADIFDALPVKNDRHTMEHPFFTLSTQKDLRVVQYEKDGVSITLSPNMQYGLPTMMDKDILLYCGSQVVAAMKEGKTPPKTIRFSIHDMMVTTNRMTNGQSYAQIKVAFERLAGCLITTNIETNGIKEASGFHILESYRVIEKSRDNRRMVKVEVTLSDWFYRSLVGLQVLTINRDYFRLRKTLERRLYELARKHCGNQAEWDIGLAKLHHKTGSRSPLKKFRFQIREIIKTNAEKSHFPDYEMALSDNDIVTFTNKKALLGAKQGMFDLDDLPYIASETLEKARYLVSEAGTGWDFNALHQDFTKSLMEGFRPDNANGAFINFVKKKVATTP